MLINLLLKLKLVPVFNMFYALKLLFLNVPNYKNLNNKFLIYFIFLVRGGDSVTLPSRKVDQLCHVQGGAAQADSYRN